MNNLKKWYAHGAYMLVLLSASIFTASCSDDDDPVASYSVEGDWEGTFTMYDNECISACPDQACADNCIAQGPVDTEIVMTITGDEVVISGFTQNFDLIGTQEITGNSITIIVGNESGGATLDEFRFELVGTINKTTNTISGTITQYENNVALESDYDFTFEVTKQ